jgi:MFS family permease
MNEVGAYTLGCFFGAVATIWLGNMLGRKRTIFIGSVIMIVGAILQTAAFGLPQLIVGRVITGFGNGKYPFPTSLLHHLTSEKA